MAFDTGTIRCPLCRVSVGRGHFVKHIIENHEVSAERRRERGINAIVRHANRAAANADWGSFREYLLKVIK